MDSELIFQIKLESNFWKLEFLMYSKSGEIVAKYREINFIFRGYKDMYVYNTNEILKIKQTGSKYVFSFLDAEYELKYGTFDFKGFYLDGKKVGAVRTRKVSTGNYTKELEFYSELSYYFLFVLFYVGVDYFDLN